MLNDEGKLVSARLIDENDEAEGIKRYAYVETSPVSERFNFFTKVDSLCKEAIDEFIKVTYEAYKKHVGTNSALHIPRFLAMSRNTEGL